MSQRHSGLPMSLVTTLLLLSAGSLISTNASAAETDTLDSLTVTASRIGASPAQGYRPGTSSMVTGRQTDFLDQARTVNAITPQMIADISADSLTDAMAFVPGVTQGNTMGGTEAGFMKRGFGSNSDGSVLRDGIRQPRNTFPLFTTERIEVLKGPGSFRYGIQEPGGVINLVTKKPQYEWQRTISGEGSSFGGGNASIDLTGPLGDSGAAFRFIVGHQDKDYWRNFGNNRQTVIAPSLAWEDDDTRLWLAYEYRDYDLTLDRGTAFVDGRPVDIPRKRRLDENWSRVTGHDQSLTARWEQDLDADWTSRLTWGWNRRQYDDGQPRVLSVDEQGNARRRADANHGFDRRVIYSAAELLGNVDLAGIRHEITLGADHERRRDYLADRYRGTTDTISIYDPDYGDLDLDGATYETARSNRLDEINSTAAYVDDAIHLGERWTLGLGGRYQYTEQKGGQGRPFVTDTDSDDTVFLPHASLLYRIDPVTSAYASYSESFIPNVPDSDTGQTFDPEEGHGWEIGLKRRLLEERLEASLAYFEITKKNVVVTDNGVSNAVGKSDARGVELALQGQLTDRLSLLGSYTWTDAEVRKDAEGGTEGNELPNVARHTASLLLTRELDVAPENGRWRVGGGLRYVGHRQGDAENSFSLDDYTVADAFIAWDNGWLGDNTHVQLNVHNLFDTTYYPSSGGDTRVVVGDPMEVSLSASLSF
ncbi:iron complex outermembrane recepter protein [Kushneria avicenniae]|uniref:Iron complex outermembrane recepter protein n=1 Tax=Kushneria avicenniae TaxID=402385 RepID=A0A1I1JRX8_9GAMM|nr:TonB-dependent siderophore receptor [Kushneria avicenniae]SFC50981.1 iron complex outermembrane recepter protein [Kushneria avicenniae]